MTIKEARKINGFNEEELKFKINFLKANIRLNEKHLDDAQSEDEQGEIEGWLREDGRFVKKHQELLNKLQKENDQRSKA